MRFHSEREKRLHPMPLSRIDEALPRNAKFVLHRHEPLRQRPFKGQSLHSESWPQEDGISDESPMITACYEAHLAMKKMLAVFAEMRGDDADDAIG